MIADADFTEDTLVCISAGAAFYLPDIRFTIDVGGQSITAIAMNQDAEVTNFMRNDKCASGSGRFLEMMSDKLKVGISEIDARAADSKKTVEISNQCGVFAEGEVISHINNGERVADVMAGVCSSVARMTAAQGRRFGITGDYTITGGVAKISSVTSTVRDKLGGNYHTFPHDPQLAAAIGAALLGDPG
jgi:predicted CoA-substrate-specific enzyme activase